jgi:16S rRNA (uracil1498-N3)-methyltransferase
MQLPFFYLPTATQATPLLQLPEATSKHIIQVLRMQIGHNIHVTNGLGQIFTCTIVTDNRKRCEVKITETKNTPPNTKKITIAISVVKNSSRLEWFIEKATELGTHQIVLLNTERTEKNNIKLERLQNIAVSAMLQSQQTYLPNISVNTLANFFLQDVSQQKFIAHCLPQQKVPLKQQQINTTCSILIGPEGDFSDAEINQAIQQNYLPVSLGNTRLRTETAGVVAASILCL